MLEILAGAFILGMVKVGLSAMCAAVARDEDQLSKIDANDFGNLQNKSKVFLKCTDKYLQRENGSHS